MGQFGKRNRDQQDLPADDVGHEPTLVSGDLVTGKKTGHKGGNRNGQKKVIIESRKNPDFGECDPPKNKKDDTHHYGNGQKVSQGFGDCRPADSQSLF